MILDPVKLTVSVNYLIALGLGRAYQKRLQATQQACVRNAPPGSESPSQNPEKWTRHFWGHSGPGSTQTRSVRQVAVNTVHVYSSELHLWGKACLAE